MVLSRVVPCGLGLAGVQAGSRGRGESGRLPRESSSPLPGSPVRYWGPVQGTPKSRGLVVLLNLPGSQRLGKRVCCPSYEPWARGTCRPRLLLSPALFSPPAWLCSFPLHTLPSLRDRLGK